MTLEPNYLEFNLQHLAPMYKKKLKLYVPKSNNYYRKTNYENYDLLKKQKQKNWPLII